jgi:hypothetical protein
MCKLCDTAHAGNLKRHLEREHPEVLEADQSAASGAADPVPYTRESSSYQRRFEAVVGFVIADGLPLSVVESERFRELVEVLDPRFSLPSRKTLKEHLKQKFITIKQQIHLEARRAPALAFTADAWTSPANQGYVGVTVHFVSAQWKLVSKCLGLRQLAEAHTAENLMNIITEIIGDLHPLCMITDNGANICSAMDMLPRQHHITCAAHTLQLVVRKALDHEVIKSLLSRAHQIVGFFKHSTVASSRLARHCAAQGLTKTKLISDCPTRWNSTLQMLERLVALREPVAASLAQPTGKPPTPFSADELALAQTLVQLLGPFNLATDALSAEKQPTLSLILPIVRRLREGLIVGDTDSPVVSIFKEVAATELQRRFLTRRDRVDLMSLTSLLDPRFKRGICDSVDAAIHMLKPRCGSPPASSQGPAPPPPPSSSALSLLFPPSARPASTVDEEITRYLADSAGPDESALNWWLRNETRYPLVATAARQYLAIPATTAPVERLFSLAGETMDPRRTRLSAEMMEVLVVLQRAYQHL